MAASPVARSLLRDLVRVDPAEHDRAYLNALRIECPVARSNAETSVRRLADEPGASPADHDLASGHLASSHRFIQSAMALEAGLHREPKPLFVPAMRSFAGDLDAMVQQLVLALRDPYHPIDDLPDLRADQNRLVEAIGGNVATAGPLDALAAETERMTNSLNTMVQLLQR